MLSLVAIMARGSLSLTAAGFSVWVLTMLATPMDAGAGKPRKPTLTPSTSMLTFSAIEGGSAPSQTVRVQSQNGGIVNWSAKSSAGWLAFAASFGGAEASLITRVSTESLAPGDYSASISVSATTSGGTKTISIPVALAITPTAPATLGPQTRVTCPAGATVVAPGSSIQAAVQSAPEGATICLAAGNHVRQSLTPKARQTFVGESGTTLDGEGVTARAFTASADGVTIRNLVITRYVTARQNGAVHGTAAGWTVENCEIRESGYFGIWIGGPRWTVRRSLVHHNAVVGINGFQADDVLIEDNELAHNGTAMRSEDPATGEAGGLKFLKHNNLAVRNNNVHDNLRGIWIDTAYLGTLIEQNRVSDHLKTGIYVEATYDAIVRDNVVERNGFNGQTTGTRAGIQVVSASNVEIYGNTVTDNARGITGTHASGYPDGPHGPLLLQNLYVHDNVVSMTSGWSGVEDLTGNTAVFSSWNNRFQRNTYHLGPSAQYFFWLYAFRTEIEWKRYGQDTTGRFLR
jgi:nitrous oxidase accessory protein NosD